VKSLVVREVPLRAIRGLIEREHYSRSCPPVASRAFGVFVRDRLEGAVVISNGSAHARALLLAGRPDDVATLSRLWLSDDLPKNAESRVLGIVVRTLRRERRYKALVTFADPEAGHDGGIYRAAGFTYLGTTNPDSVIVIDGKEHHPRTVSSALGSNGVAHLRRTGIDARRRQTAPKHRYAVALDRAWSWRFPRPMSHPSAIIDGAG